MRKTKFSLHIYINDVYFMRNNFSFRVYGIMKASDMSSDQITTGKFSLCLFLYFKALK